MSRHKRLSLPRSKRGAGAALVGLSLVLVACGQASAPAASSPASAPGSPASAPASSQASPKASQPAASARSASAAPKPSTLGEVRVALASPNYTPWAPLFYAKENGFFDKLGVQVTTTPYNGGGPMQQALASGSADVIQFPPFGMIPAVNKGVKEHIVAVNQPYANGWYILVKKDSPIKALADLNGKKIGISGTGSATEIYARWALGQGHAQGQLVPLGPQGIIPNLIAGHVDAGIGTPPQSFQADADGLRILVDLGTQMPAVVQDSVVASDSIISAHPAAVRAYLEGLFQGIVYMKKHPDEAVQFMVKYTKQPQALEQQEYQNEILKLSDDGTINPAWIDNALKLAGQAGIKDLPPAKTLYDPQFTPVKVAAP